MKTTITRISDRLFGLCILLASVTGVRKVWRWVRQSDCCELLRALNDGLMKQNESLLTDYLRANEHRHALREQCQALNTQVEAFQRDMLRLRGADVECEMLNERLVHEMRKNAALRGQVTRYRKQLGLPIKRSKKS